MTILEGKRTPPEELEDVEFEAERAPLGTEYWLGARLLPRLGAVIIILAIAFIAISESAKNNALDRSVLLAMEAFFCLCFIAVGEWRRDEMEGFGRTLSATGVIGLYITAAGGFFAYHTLTAAGMAGLFALLSIGCHAYATWRNTRLFFMIGATGGLAAMLFTLAERDYATGLAVTAAVTLAGAGACAIRRWQGLAFLGWVFGLALLTPAIVSDFSRHAVLATLYTVALACAAAVVAGEQREEHDLSAFGAALIFGGTGALSLLILRGLDGVLFTVLYSGVGVAIGALVRKTQASRVLTITAAANAALILPLNLPPNERTMFFLGLVAFLAAFGTRFGSQLAAAFAVGAYLASILSYTDIVVRGLPHTELILLALFFGVPLCAASIRNAQWGYVSFCVASLWILVSRASFVLAPTPTQSNDQLPFSIPSLASAGYAMLLLMLGFRYHHPKLRVWSMAILLATVLQILVLDTGTTPWFRLLTLLVLGGVMLYTGFHYVREKQLESASPSV